MARNINGSIDWFPMTKLINRNVVTDEMYIHLIMAFSLSTFIATSIMKRAGKNPSDTSPASPIPNVEMA